MKILIISNLYEPYARGGAEAVVKTTAEELVRRNHEVIVLTAGPAKVGLSPKESLQNGVRVLRFFPLNLYFVKDDWRFSKILRIFARLIDLVHIQSAEVVRRLLAKEQPDVVITHNLVGIGFLIPRVIQRWAKKNQRKAIHVLHDVQLIHPSGLLLWKEDARAQQNILRKLYEKIMRQLMGSPSIVISPSRWLLEFHNRRGFFPKSKTIILPNPINVFPTAKRLPVTDYQLPITLLYAGQLEVHKGIKWLLDIFYSLQTTHYKLRLEIAGAGSLEGEVRKMAEAHPDKIAFHGKLTRDALMKKFQEVNALVVPSLCYENAPQIIAEAHSQGLPVIASRIGGIPEMIMEGKNGFLFTPGNAAELLSAIEKLPSLSVVPAIPMTAEQYVDLLVGLD